MCPNNSLLTYYTGWAMEAYPDMSEKDFAFHIERQLSLGANFVWIGHNNPGEVDRHKIEPALSYAVYEAYIDKNDPRHNDAVAIIDAQHRILKVCRQMGVPVVFPVGYQIQMGERWNRANPQHLRRFYGGEVIDWGGISATFLSPKYQEDITKFYVWTIENFIEPYSEIIKLINLADEPFGGDYSQWAEYAFRRQYGITFEEAFAQGREGLITVGEFQSRYVVEYARWSADGWHKLYPHIPTTMSFCGHHGREENHMPDVVALFSDTPHHFHPTFDVYPRDGSQKHPVTEADVTMLIILLRQLSYLSARHHKPYWLWTTGNSWGLGQASPDPAHISDALANQFYAVATVVANGGDLRGIAVWNYLCRNQGLFEDIHHTAYDPEQMFTRVTKILAWLRGFLGKRELVQPAEVALMLPRSFGYRRIGELKQSVWVRVYGVENLHPLAKQAGNFIVGSEVSEIIDYESTRPGTLKAIIFMADQMETLDPESVHLLHNYLQDRARIKSIPRLFLPEKIASQIRLESIDASSLIVLPDSPDKISADFWQQHLSPILQFSETNSMYVATIDHIHLIYNLSHKEQALFQQQALNGWYCQLDLSGNELQRIKLNKANKRTEIKSPHHAIGLTIPSLQADSTSLPFL